MDESSRSESGDDDSFPPAQPRGMLKRDSDLSVASSASVSSSSTSSSSSSSSSEDDDVSEAASSVHRSGAAPTVRNKYIGFQRKPVLSPEEYPTLGQRRQDRSYSDSDNEYEHEVFNRSKDRQGHGILDMDVHRDGEWGRRSLVDTLVDGGQLESLIGWAHDGAAARISSDRGPGFVNKAVDNDNPLSRLPNDPLPLSYLNHLMLQTGRLPDLHETLTEKFDTSAIVAIGIILEEILTTSLLPFAGCHVLRCRQLDSRPSKFEANLMPPNEVKLTHPITKQPIEFDQRNLSEEESAFVAWTLPPEEAILQSARQGMLPDTGIPLVRDPIRSPSCPSAGTFEVMKARKAIHRLFAKGNEKDANFLSANKDLLNIFLVQKRYKRKRKELPLEPASGVVETLTEDCFLTDFDAKVPVDDEKSNDETSTKKIKLVEV